MGLNMNCVCLIEEYNQESPEPKIDNMMIDFSFPVIPKEGENISHPSLPYDTCKVTEIKKSYATDGHVYKIEIFMVEETMSEINDYNNDAWRKENV